MTALLYCEMQREVFSEGTVSFNDKFTAPPELVLLHLIGNNYRFGRCLLPLTIIVGSSSSNSYCSRSCFLVFFPVFS